MCTFIFLYGTTIGQGTSTTYHEIVNILRNQNYTISNEYVADISQGETTFYWRTFYAGRDYEIVAMSDDDDVTDVDIYLYETDLTLYTKDADASRLAVIKFSPLITRDMKVVVKNYQSNTPNYASRCRFIVAYK